MTYNNLELASNYNGKSIICVKLRAKNGQNHQISVEKPLATAKSIAVQSNEDTHRDKDTHQLDKGLHHNRDKDTHRLLMLLIIATLVTSSAYILMCAIFAGGKNFPGGPSFFGLTIIGLVTTVIAYVVYHSQCSPKFFGITLDGANRAIKEAILFTLPILLGSIILKWIYMQILPQHAEPLFNFESQLTANQMHFNWMSFFGLLTAYMLFCPLQELIIRGGLQTILYRCFLGSELSRKILAIALSNLAFAQVHLHISLTFGVLTFMIGLFWGWMYTRHQTIVGVSISHIMVGVWVQFIVGSHFLNYQA